MAIKAQKTHSAAFFQPKPARKRQMSLQHHAKSVIIADLLKPFGLFISACD
jgi:hypothetical protein